MKSIGGSLQTALDSKERYQCVLLTFELGAEVHGIWTGGSEVEFNGIIYKGGGSAIEADDIELRSDGSIDEITLKLSADPDKGLTSDVLATFYDEDWYMQNVSIDLGMQDPDTGEVIGVELLFEGLIYEAPWPVSDSANALTLRLVSHAVKLSGAGNKMRNAKTQKQIDPDDTGFDGIGAFLKQSKRVFKFGQSDA